jgi:hypothetical protein
LERVAVRDDDLDDDDNRYTEIQVHTGSTSSGPGAKVVDAGGNYLDYNTSELVGRPPEACAQITRGLGVTTFSCLLHDVADGCAENRYDDGVSGRTGNLESEGDGGIMEGWDRVRGLEERRNRDNGDEKRSLISAGERVVVDDAKNHNF